MLAMGGLREYIATGMTVDISAVTSAIASTQSTDSGPNTNRLALMPTSFIIIEFKSTHKPNDAAADMTKQIKAIINASDINILNTSVVRAPIARRIPISFFFAVMDAEMKLNIRRKANRASTVPAITKPSSNDDAISVTVFSCSLTLFLM